MGVNPVFDEACIVASTYATQGQRLHMRNTVVHSPALDWAKTPPALAWLFPAMDGCRQLPTFLQRIHSRGW
ncbi:hypothetical protein P153DRAFT_366136 [Dothidotthia symphoricarpi CBS 119687]|uniref:Uncharacterized protein n=1 Tax=Dothidotthia symphoricarpi CBS 119687 TaxID=1392245 RepID=A0A6A6AF21_9PLEO|nr:uncharacterized protein P153DRAFT_366136 [Dothidotthia symphoricarpi CBS 119687]KAF2130562.1 hypothetical protein P153DRAFT_366136 [Dothidotthia symphoricarpi CBS 119687]